MKKFLKKYDVQIALFIFYIILADLVQSWSMLGKNLGNSVKIVIFFIIHLAVLFLCIIYIMIRRDRLMYLFSKIKNIPIPNGAKWAIAVVFLGNLTSILFGEPCYPFYDVGMFRWTTNFENAPKVVYKPKYFYWKEGKANILDLRKEGFFFLHEHFGLRYTHEFTFATTYHNKGQKENFDFILQRLKPLGIDTLWVGVHAVNYETKEVWFDTDLCNAIRVNNTENIHYGPIYVPKYQNEKCN